MPELKALEPSQIFAEIDACPPLMREQASQRYIGSEVDWPVTLADAREQKPGQAHVVFWPEPSGNRLIVGDVPLSGYPQLRSMRAGDPARARGRIRKVDTLSIELEIKELVLVQPAEAIH